MFSTTDSPVAPAPARRGAARGAARGARASRGARALGARGAELPERAAAARARARARGLRARDRRSARGAARSDRDQRLPRALRPRHARSDRASRSRRCACPSATNDRPDAAERLARARRHAARRPGAAPAARRAALPPGRSALAAPASSSRWRRWACSSPRALRSPGLWIALTAMAVARLASGWPNQDNHAFLLVWWVLAAALATLAGEASRDRILAWNGRKLVGLAFAFATLWKLVLSPDFSDGRFFRVSLVDDTRFEDFTRLVVGLDEGELADLRALRARAPGRHVRLERGAAGAARAPLRGGRPAHRVDARDRGRRGGGVPRTARHSGSRARATRCSRSSARRPTRWRRWRASAGCCSRWASRSASPRRSARGSPISSPSRSCSSRPAGPGWTC